MPRWSGAAIGRHHPGLQRGDGDHQHGAGRVRERLRRDAAQQAARQAPLRAARTARSVMLIPSGPNTANQGLARRYGGSSDAQRPAAADWRAAAQHGMQVAASAVRMDSGAFDTGALPGGPGCRPPGGARCRPPAAARTAPRPCAAAARRAHSQAAASPADVALDACVHLTRRHRCQHHACLAARATVI